VEITKTNTLLWRERRYEELLGRDKAELFAENPELYAQMSEDYFERLRKGKVSKTPAQQPLNGSSATTELTWKGKRFTEMLGKEKAELYVEDNDLYVAMRDEAAAASKKWRV